MVALDGDRGEEADPNRDIYAIRWQLPPGVRLRRPMLNERRRRNLMQPRKVEA